MSKAWRWGLPICCCLWLTLGFSELTVVPMLLMQSFMQPRRTTGEWLIFIPRLRRESCCCDISNAEYCAMVSSSSPLPKLFDGTHILDKRGLTGQKEQVQLFCCHFFRITNARQSHLCVVMFAVWVWCWGEERPPAGHVSWQGQNIWKAAFMCCCFFFPHTHLQNNRPLFKGYVTHVLLISIKQHRT